MEEYPGYKKSDPDNKSEQRNNVYHSKSPDSFLPQFLEIRDKTDGEKGQGKEK